MRIFVLLLLFFSMPIVYAEEHAELYRFASPKHQERFQDLTHQFRCLVCQNQTLADSNAPLAVDMKNKIFTMIDDGANDQEITTFLKDRYGDFISYQPPFNQATLLLWLGPLGILILGFLVVFRKSGKLHSL